MEAFFNSQFHLNDKEPPSIHNIYWIYIINLDGVTKAWTPNRLDAINHVERILKDLCDTDYKTELDGIDLSNVDAFANKPLTINIQKSVRSWWPPFRTYLQTVHTLCISKIASNAI